MIAIRCGKSRHRHGSNKRNFQNVFVSFPAKSFARWDDLLQCGKIWSLGASDAHGGFRIGKFFAVNVPSYADVFSLAGLGIDQKYAAHPEQAIRNGDFFNCIRGAAEPQLFDFSTSDGRAIYTSGSNLPERSELHVNIEVAGLATRLILIRNGKIESQVDGGTSLFGSLGWSLSAGSLSFEPSLAATRRSLDRV
jgi:hypothetical protein